MAFQPPQRQQPRPTSSRLQSAPAFVDSTATAKLPPREQIPDDTEWILFSPDTPILTREDTTSSKTAGRSRLSDFGSLETAAVSEKARQEQPEEDGEGEDLDSLDDGLHAFSEPLSPYVTRRVIDQSTDTVLPAHDGLGMFPGSSSPVQEQFWHHERYNPRRRRHSLRRTSLQKKVEAQEEEEGSFSQDDRFQRIEKWRAEQSKAILEEIERETRRRKRKNRLSASRLESSKGDAQQPSTPKSEPKERAASPQTLSFWERVTRSLRSLIGIDDATLSFIFGEALPTDDNTSLSAAEMIEYAERTAPNDGQLARLGDSWEEKFLARIAKELGYLMHHITTHPGAFSTYLKTQEPIPYAGLHTFDSQEPLTQSQHILPPSVPHFAPTIPPQHRRRQSAATTDPSLWGIEEEDENELPSIAQPVPTASQEAKRLDKDREYWERDLDVKMVFGYLRNRISQPSSTTVPASTSNPSATARAAPSTNTHNSSLRRAALIRHHHPLVSRNYEQQSSAQNRRVSEALHHSPTTPLSPILGRRHNYEDEGALSSCASQSTNKRSKTGHSNGKGGGGSSLNRSRNYWDWDWGVGGVAGSVGSGPAYSAGWGEV